HVHLLSCTVCHIRLQYLPARATSLHLLFLFFCSVALRDLHSFPTRRSSDLPALSHCPGASSPGKMRQPHPLSPSPVTRRTPPRRSEEHTSELQSLAYLVCRLLLEKKKTKQTKHQRTLSIATQSTLV